MKADQIDNNFLESSREIQILARGHTSAGGSSFQQDFSQPGEGGVLLSTADTDTALDSQITEILFFLQ